MVTLKRTKKDFHDFEMCDDCWNGIHKRRDPDTGVGCDGHMNDGSPCKCPHHDRVKRKKREKPEQMDMSQFGTIEVK